MDCKIYGDLIWVHVKEQRAKKLLKETERHMEPSIQKTRGNSLKEHTGHKV